MPKIRRFACRSAKVTSSTLLQSQSDTLRRDVLLLSCPKQYVGHPTNLQWTSPWQYLFSEILSSKLTNLSARSFSQSILLIGQTTLGLSQHHTANPYERLSSSSGVIPLMKGHVETLYDSTKHSTRHIQPSLTNCWTPLTSHTCAIPDGELLRSFCCLHPEWQLPITDHPPASCPRAGGGGGGEHISVSVRSLLNLSGIAWGDMVGLVIVAIPPVLTSSLEHPDLYFIKQLLQ